MRHRLRLKISRHAKWPLPQDANTTEPRERLLNDPTSTAASTATASATGTESATKSTPTRASRARSTRAGRGKMLSRAAVCLPNLRSYLLYLSCYLLIVVAAGSRVVSGLKCFCNPRECDVIRALDCPGKGLMLWDPCKCCRICAKTLGEACGGPGGFSGQCEPPLQCVTKLPINSGLGVCRDLPFSSPSSTYHSHNCTNAETIVLEPGCEITNKRCQCWPSMRVCRSDDDGGATTDTRWHFNTLEDCQLNLQNLIKVEMDFDEDYTISPSTFTYKKLRRKRRSLRKRTLVITH